MMAFIPKFHSDLGASREGNPGSVCPATLDDELADALTLSDVLSQDDVVDGLLAA
jgi:hypothetical protein